jgi:magnesium-transporting ATPase (P-type)
MADGNQDAEAMKSFIKLNRIYLSVNPILVPNIEVLSQAMKNMQELREFRRHRILSSKNSMPDILWIVIILSSVILVVFTFFFSTKNMWHQYVMTAFLVFVSVLVLYLIFVLDHPFVGQNAIKPEAFQPLMDIISRSGK